MIRKRGASCKLPSPLTLININFTRKINCFFLCASQIKWVTIYLNLINVIDNKWHRISECYSMLLQTFQAHAQLVLVSNQNWIWIQIKAEFILYKLLELFLWFKNNGQWTCINNYDYYTLKYVCIPFPYVDVQFQNRWNQTQML